MAKSLSQRPKRWGVFLLALWAAVLSFQAISPLLILSASVVRDSNPIRLWTTFFISLCFSIAFALSAYGLWQEHHWGRMLFIWIVIVWSIVNLTVLLLPDSIFGATPPRTALGWVMAVSPYLISLLWPVWYLNVPDVKETFS